MRCTLGLLPLLIGATLASPVSADEIPVGEDDLSVSGDVGVANIQASEYVFHGPVQISRLDWKTQAAVIANARIVTRLSNKWSLKGNISLSIADLGGDMVDRDWLYRDDAGPSGADDWTHRSDSPETKLDHFIQGGIEIDRTLIESGGFAVSAGPGVKFTDVQWTAWGGSYVYSDSYDTFRNIQGSVSSSLKAITYRQSIPVVYLGLNVQDTIGDLVVSGSVRGGASLGFRDADQHFLRYLDFDQSMSVAPFAGAAAQISYAVDEITNFYASASAERVFFARGDRKETETLTGDVASFSDSAGASFQTMALSAGFKRRF